MKKLWLICLLISLAGCEPEFDIFDVPGKDFKITIQSFNEAGRPWYIQTAVSKSTAPWGTLDSLSDAIVKIYEDGNFVEQLIFDGFTDRYTHAAIFRSFTNSPTVGHEYKITVEAPGYPMATATYRQPDPVPADMTFQFRSRQLSTAIVVTNGTAQEIPIDRWVFDVIFTFTDPPGDNYYDFILETAASEEDFQKRNTNTAYIYLDSKPYESSPLLRMTDDKGSSGKRVTYKFSYAVFDSQEKPEWFRMSLRTMTEAQYKYTTRLYKSLVAQYDPYAQPVTTFTNVENGLGIFSAYTPSYSEIFKASYEE